MGKICLWCGKPLPKRRRKYCSDHCSFKYWQKYLAPLLWLNARALALERAEYKCEECDRRGNLEVHHIVKLEIDEPRLRSKKNEQDNLRVLCRPCHEKAHHPHAYEKINEIPKEQMVMEFTP